MGDRNLLHVITFPSELPFCAAAVAIGGGGYFANRKNKKEKESVEKRGDTFPA